MGYGCVSQWVDLHRGSNGKCDCLMSIRKPCFPTTDGRLVMEKVDGNLRLQVRAPCLQASYIVIFCDLHRYGEQMMMRAEK